MSKKIDIGVLDEIIGACEKSMVSPFKKEPKQEEESISDDGFNHDELMEMYEEMVGK